MRKNLDSLIEFFKIYSEDKLALIFFIILVFILALVLVGPFFTLQNPYDLSQINIVGEDIDSVDWGFQRGNTFASQGQKMIYWGPLKPLEKALLRSPITPLAYAASNLYHNEYWLRFIGKQRINKAMQTKWGNLFRKY